MPSIPVIAQKIEAFWNGSSGGSRQVDHDLHLRKESGGFNLIKIVSDNETQLDAIAADSGEMFIGLKLEVESASPPDVRISLHGVPSKDGIVPAFANHRELVSALQKRAETLVAADQFSGTILLVRNGKTLLRRAYGEADRSSHRKVTLDTQFRIGSMNKMFTAVAILQLVEQGKLSLDDHLIKNLARLSQPRIGDQGVRPPTSDSYRRYGRHLYDRVRAAPPWRSERWRTTSHFMALDLLNLNLARTFDMQITGICYWDGSLRK